MDIHGIQAIDYGCYKLVFSCLLIILYINKPLARTKHAHRAWGTPEIFAKNTKFVNFEFQSPAYFSPKQGSKHTLGGPLKHLQPLLSFETLPNASTNSHGLYL